MTPAEAQLRAAAEGLSLVLKEGTPFGYYGVASNGGPNGKYFRFKFRHEGKEYYCGGFNSPEEAALELARRHPAEAAAAAVKHRHGAVVRMLERQAHEGPAPTTAEEIEAIAASEGLTLNVAPELKHGYRGIFFGADKKLTRPWKAEIPGEPLGSVKSVGYFRTKFEAALEIARRLGPKLSAERAAEKRNRQGWLVGDKELSPQEALAAAAAESLTLPLAETAAEDTYRGVRRMPTKVGGRYQSFISGRSMGAFGCKEEAALVRARRLRDVPGIAERIQEEERLRRTSSQECCREEPEADVRQERAAQRQFEEAAGDGVEVEEEARLPRAAKRRRVVEVATEEVASDDEHAWEVPDAEIEVVEAVVGDGGPGGSCSTARRRPAAVVTTVEAESDDDEGNDDDDETLIDSGHPTATAVPVAGSPNASTKVPTIIPTPISSAVAATIPAIAFATAFAATSSIATTIATPIVSSISMPTSLGASLATPCTATATTVESGLDCGNVGSAAPPFRNLEAAETGQEQEGVADLLRLIDNFPV